MKEHIFNKLASFAAIVIMALPVGIACFFFGFILLDNPCAFCWQERTAMILVALTALYIVRFGLKRNILPRWFGWVFMVPLWHPCILPSTSAAT